MLLQKLTEKEVQLLKEQEQREAIEARLVHRRHREQQREEEDEQHEAQTGKARNMWKGYPVLTRKTVPLDVPSTRMAEQKIYVSAGRVICFRFRFKCTVQKSTLSSAMSWMFPPTDVGFKLKKRHGEFSAGAS